MMVKGITVPAALLMAVLTGLNRQYCRAVTFTIVDGIRKGYSMANIEWLCKQIRLETGRGSSSAIVADRNAFGMSCVARRQTTQVGCRQLSDGNTSGKYATIEKGIEDRYLWDAYTGSPHAMRKAIGYPQQVVQSGYHASSAYASVVSSISGADYRIGLGCLSAFPVLGLVTLMLAMK